MDADYLSYLLSDFDVQEQIAIILEKALTPFLETDRFYEQYNPITKQMEHRSELVNIPEVLLSIAESLQKIAAAAEHNAKQ